MTPHRTGHTGLRTLQVTGALVAAMALAGCGGAAGSGGTAQPPVQHAQSAHSPSTASPAFESLPAESSGTASTSGDAQPKPSPEESSRCHTSMLSGALEPGSPGAGQRYAELVLRNTSAETCTLYGYGGLQLIGADGNPLPTDLERTPNPGPTMLRLAPGDSASATLHWTAVPHGDEGTEGPCQPTPASVQVIPPDETDPLTVKWEMGPVCGHGSIDGTAYHR